MVDYRNGEDALVAAIEEILAKKSLTKVLYVLDAISENGSLEAILRFIEPMGGIVSTVLPPNMFARDKENFKWPPGVKGINGGVPRVQETHKDFGYLWSRYLGRLLEDGRLKAHPYEIIPGGLNGVLTGLQNLKDGKASGVKYVYRIKDTGDIPMPSNQITDGRPTGGQSSHPLNKFPFPGTKN